MNGTKLISIAVGCVSVTLSSPAIAKCSLDLPQVGVLELPSGGEARVLRKGETLNAGNGTLLCISDRLLSGAAAGQVKLISGEVLQLPANSQLDLPNREKGLLDLLIASFRSKKVFRVMGSMANREPGVSLETLVSGTAMVSPFRGSLIVPVNPANRAYTISLYRDKSTKPIDTVRVDPDVGWVHFKKMQLQRGRYVIQIEGSNKRASFQVGTVNVSPAISAAGLMGPEAAFAHGCMDPARNFFDAIQLLDRMRADQRYLDALLAWQWPNDRLSCASPKVG